MQKENNEVKEVHEKKFHKENKDNRENRKKLLEEKVRPVFQNHVITYRGSYSNTINSAKNSSSSIQVEREIDLMTNINVYGAAIWNNSGYDIGMDNHQYSLFRLKPSLINTSDYWLRNIENGYFLRVAMTGFSGNYSASLKNGVRPRFLIG